MTAIGDAHHIAREPINPGPDVEPKKQPPDFPSPGPDIPDPPELNPDLNPEDDPPRPSAVRCNFTKWYPKWDRKTGPADFHCKFLRLDAASSGDGIRLKVKLTQSDFASLVGVTRQYASRFIGELRAAGVLEWRGSMIAVKDVTRLTEMAAN